MSFEFPPIYSFKPFFTAQINEQTWNAQLQNWVGLILSYCRHYRVWTLDLNRAGGGSHNGAVDGELFRNSEIDRQLKNDTIRQIFDHMVKHNQAEWMPNTNHTTLLVYFKTPQEWATVISDWARETGHINSVLTFYELSEGDLVTNTEFYGIESTILRKAIDILVTRGTAAIMKGSDGKVAGVKLL